MSKPNKNGPAKNVSMDIYSAIAVSHANIDGCLRQMKQPINQSKASQARLLEDLKVFVTELYNNVKLSIKKGILQSDSTGVLTNKTIYTTNAATKKELVHWALVGAIIDNLISADQDTIDMAKSDKKDVVEPIKTPSKEEIDQTVVGQETPADVVAPVVDTPVTPLAQSINPAAGTTPAPVLPGDINTTFHIPFMAEIDKVLLVMNDAEDEELPALRSDLGLKVRAWIDASYKSLHDIENPNRLMVDKVGLLISTTQYSSPEYHAKYDYAHMVDKILAKANAKYSKTDTEASIHAMATAISGAQDDSKSTFTVPTGNGESVEVDKSTGDITAKKDGKVVSFFKGIYKGVKKFFSNLWKQMKRFGAWIKSWFVKDKSEERIDVSPEEAEKMEAEAKLKAASMTAAKA